MVAYESIRWRKKIILACRTEQIIFWFGVQNVTFMNLYFNFDSLTSHFWPQRQIIQQKDFFSTFQNILKKSRTNLLIESNLIQTYILYCSAWVSSVKLGLIKVKFVRQITYAFKVMVGKIELLNRINMDYIL